MNGRNKIVELEENVSYFGATHSDWLYSAMCMEEISFFLYPYTDKKRRRRTVLILLRL
jgi:hypothetical protein